MEMAIMNIQNWEVWNNENKQEAKGFSDSDFREFLVRVTLKGLANISKNGPA